MKILSKLQAPAIAGVVREKTAKAAIAEIKNCMQSCRRKLICQKYL